VARNATTGKSFLKSRQLIHSAASNTNAGKKTEKIRSSGGAVASVCQRSTAPFRQARGTTVHGIRRRRVSIATNAETNSKPSSERPDVMEKPPILPLLRHRRHSASRESAGAIFLPSAIRLANTRAGAFAGLSRAQMCFVLPIATDVLWQVIEIITDFFIYRSHNAPGSKVRVLPFQKSN